jgi:hypothetical protein
MTKEIFDISISPDEFVTASNVSREEPLGDGGQRLHEWAFSEHERTSARPLYSPHGAVPRQDGRYLRRGVVALATRARTLEGRNEEWLTTR